MVSLDLVLLVAAAVCFFIAAIGIAVQRINLIALGLFLWIVSIIV